ncbi:MAG: response regulator [Eubacterium sp.]|nr:response regulator [Eubacterium sp.]
MGVATRKGATVMIMGEKETFLIRVLMKKIQDAGMETTYVQSKGDSIGNEIMMVDFVVYYMEANEKLDTEFLRLLSEQLATLMKQIIIIGEKTDIDFCRRYLKDSVILDSIPRPLDTEKFVKKLTSYSRRGGAVNSFKRNILIIDDDPAYMNVVHEWLKDEYTVIMTTSADQAFGWLMSHTPDLILLDYEMPKVSGPEVLSQLRAVPEYSKLPVFFLTGKSDRESVMQVMSMKPQNYILKSVGREDLKQKLEAFFH